MSCSKGSAVALGAQDVHFEKKGAFTGEVSPAMLIEAGCKYVIVGHSERRHGLGESDAAINQKVHTALEEGLQVILCVGETLAERERNLQERVFQRQVYAACAGLTDDAVRPARPRLRAGLGDRHRQGRDAGAGPAGAPQHPGANGGNFTAIKSPVSFLSSTAAPSPPTTPPVCSRSRTWTAG